jgi:hypothetical protein
MLIILRINDFEPRDLLLYFKEKLNSHNIDILKFNIRKSSWRNLMEGLILVCKSEPDEEVNNLYSQGRNETR